MNGRKRVLFLFNHDAAHQVAHVAGIMAELALTRPEIETIAAVGTPAIEKQLRAIVSPEAAQALTWEDLSLSGLSETLLTLPNAILPAKRLARLRSNERLFASVDMLVSPERTCLAVKERLSGSGKCPKFVFVPHGAGDRSVSYHPALSGFDYHLVSGAKVRDEMVAHQIARPEDVRIIGYAKFDAFPDGAGKQLFDNDRPTILYNPHFDPHLSSWYDHGPQLLSSFAAMGDRFNLVFAPHVMLWRKRLHISPEYRVARFRPDLPEGIAPNDNVIVDTDSPALFDMTYTTAADIYVGDVSSQVYEFLRTPKPCIFIDAAGDGADAYPFWQNGPVVNDSAGVLAELENCEELASSYRETQQKLFSYTIDHDPQRSASVRGAEAIAELVAG